MERRDFVRTTLSVAGVTVLAGGSAACGAPASPPEGVDIPGLLGSMGHDRIMRIGQAYLAAVPSERTLPQLQTAIQKALAPWPWSAPIAVDARVTDDFAQYRTVQADGWMLSVTEARQCALYSLMRS